MKFRILLLGTLVSAVLCMSACQHTPKGAKKFASSEGTHATSSNEVAKPLVAKVVFIGKKQACNCTKARITDSLHAVKMVLREHPGVKFVELQVDEDVPQANVYKSKKPIMVIPAIYFVDADDNLIEMLQGEVTRAQVYKVFGSGANESKSRAKKPLAG